MYEELTQEYLHTRFEYKEGELYWKKALSNRCKVGDVAGDKDGRGYRRVMLGKKHYKVHIIIWIMHYGHYPEPFIVDHKNRIKDYNYIDNLRLFTKSQNALNVDAVYKGVTFDSDRNKWRAQISINNKTVMLGRYNTREEAELSYEFATINREA